MGDRGNVPLSVLAIICFGVTLGLISLATDAPGKINMLLKALQIAP